MAVWYERRSRLKVRDLIEKVALWVKAGFVSPDVWLDIKEVSSDVLCDYIKTTSIDKKPENDGSDCKTYIILSWKKLKRVIQ